MIGDTFYGFQFAKNAPLEKGQEQNDVPENPSRVATTYYHRDGPVGQVLGKFDWFPGTKGGLESRSDARLPASLVGMVAPVGTFSLNGLPTLWSEPAIGVIRINAGTHAAYSRPFQQIHFYNNTSELTAFSLPRGTAAAIQLHQRRAAARQLRQGYPRRRTNHIGEAGAKAILCRGVRGNQPHRPAQHQHAAVYQGGAGGFHGELDRKGRHVFPRVAPLSRHGAAARGRGQLPRLCPGGWPRTKAPVESRRSWPGLASAHSG